jgi:lactoylglutathione lyase
VVAAARSAGALVLREAEDKPWGERVAVVADPDGNPVALATAG